MARRTSAVVDVTEILIHWQAGRSKSEVAASLGVHRGTVAKYVARAEAEGFVPGGPPLSPEQWAALVRGWFPELVDPDLRHPLWSRIVPFHDRIRVGLETNTATTVWQRLRDDDGLDVSITTFRRYLYAHLPEEVARAEVTVRRDDPAPGQEAQIDYGFLGRWLDPATGTTRRVWAFVMVLARSRHMFVRPVLSMNLAAWVAAHVAAWEFFDGVTARLVPDNLKTGVLKPDLYDPKLNRTYAELAAHYGTLIDPARAGRPKDKPRVENPMPYVRDSFWRGREFCSEAEMQAAALVWSREVAGRRHCRPLDGAAPAVVFDAIEAAALLPLPHQPFELVAWSTPKVGADIHAKVGRTLYSVPWRYLGRRLDARESASTVEFFVDGALIKTHVRTERGKQTDWSDYPPEKVAFFMRTPTWCRHRAGEVGPACTALLELNALYRLRSAQGVLGLADRHGAPRLEAACRRALEVGDPSYRTVKGILLAGTESDTTEESRAPNAPAHLHGPGRLFELDGAAS